MIDCNEILIIWLKSQIFFPKDYNNNFGFGSILYYSLLIVIVIVSWGYYEVDDVNCYCWCHRTHTHTHTLELDTWSIIKIVIIDIWIFSDQQ